jgi:hypothetical protein
MIGHSSIVTGLSSKTTVAVLTSVDAASAFLDLQVVGVLRVHVKTLL